MRAALSLCLVLAMSSLACAGGSDENQPGDAGSSPDSFTLPDDAAMADTAVDTAPPLSPELAALCAKKAAPITVPGTTRCMGDLARATFLFGACSCTDLIVTTGNMNFNVINSTKAASAGGAIAANGRVVGNDPMVGVSNISVQGSLWAAGVGSIQPVVALGAGEITGNLRCGGNLTAVNADIKGDAYVAGSVTDAILRIGGALHQPASSPPPTGPAGTITPGGGIVTEAVSVPPPCNCSQPLPIASIVAATKTDNDNAALGLTPTSLDDRTGNLTLGCGRFYFDAIKLKNPLSIRVVGPTAIFVAGDIEGHLNLEVLPGGQLDLFVGGNIRLGGAWRLGSVTAPANSRVYVAGSSVALDGAFSIDSNLYAPNAEFASSASAFTVRGSIYARKIHTTGVAAHVTYDQAVQELTGCQPPGGGCTSCRDCSGATPACKGGTCGKCTSDADCCAPLVCKSDGTCVSGIR